MWYVVLALPVKWITKHNVTYSTYTPLRPLNNARPGTGPQTSGWKPLILSVSVMFSQCEYINKLDVLKYTLRLINLLSFNFIRLSFLIHSPWLIPVEKPYIPYKFLFNLWNQIRWKIQGNVTVLGKPHFWMPLGLCCF